MLFSNESGHQKALEYGFAIKPAAQGKLCFIAVQYVR